MAQGVRDLAIQLGVAFTIILLGYALRALKVQLPSSPYSLAYQMQLLRLHNPTLLLL
jgi:hypothetical protein